jgi:hypothetical protein
VRIENISLRFNLVSSRSRGHKKKKNKKIKREKEREKKKKKKKNWRTTACVAERSRGEKEAD